MAISVNDMLTLYLEVHNGLFAQPWWRSIPIPGLFKAIAFEQLQTQLSDVDGNLKTVKDEVRRLYEQGAPHEQVFLGALHRYTVALSNTVIAFNPVVAGLRSKTEGKPYSKTTYNEHLAAYREAEKEYHALGAEMNRQWQIYRQGS